MKRKRKSSKIRQLLLAITAVAGIGVIVFILINAVSVTTAGNNISSDQTTSESTSVAASADKLTLFAVGDNIMHQSVLDSAKKSDGSYDFSNYYTDIKADVKRADLAFVNQETPIGGASLGVLGYPVFNSPYELARDLVNVGFNVVSQATNHIVDKGRQGVLNTIECWGSYPSVQMIGITNKKDSKPLVSQKNNISYSFLAYTSYLNMDNLGASNAYMVKMIDKETMKNDIEYARGQGAEIIIVSLHWGVEYSYQISTYQKDIAKYLNSLGVDVILGTHPHVLEPVEWITSETGHKTLVYYSLGNFLSSQEEIPRMLGGAAAIEFDRDQNGQVAISKSSLIPIVTHFVNGKKDFKVYKLSDYTEQLASVHGVSAFGEKMTLQKLKDLAKNILGTWYQE